MVYWGSQRLVKFVKCLLRSVRHSVFILVIIMQFYTGPSQGSLKTPRVEYSAELQLPSEQGPRPEKRASGTNEEGSFSSKDSLQIWSKPSVLESTSHTGKGCVFMYSYNHLYIMLFSVCWNIALLSLAGS